MERVEDEDGGPKQPWEPPSLTCVGRMADIVQFGGGKLSPPGGDPGDPRKEQPTG